MRKRLTDREVQILALVAEGYSYNAVAKLSGTLETTVRNQMYTIITKLQARNNVHAVTLAIKLGYLSLITAVEILKEVE